MEPAAVTLFSHRDSEGCGCGGGGRGGAGGHRGRGGGGGGCLAHKLIVLGADEVVPLASGPHHYTVLLLIGVAWLIGVPVFVTEGCSVTPHVGLLCLLVI